MSGWSDAYAGGGIRDVRIRRSVFVVMVESVRCNGRELKKKGVVGLCGEHEVRHSHNPKSIPTYAVILQVGEGSL